MQEDKSPALPEIREEQDRMVIRIGDSEITQTKEAIICRARCRSRPEGGGYRQI